MDLLKRSAPLLLLAAVALAALLAACRAKEPEPPPPPLPERIVAVSPSITEILFALGLGDRVVGVGDYSRWPPEVESKPRIGGLYDARIEQIVALRPDLAVLLPSEDDLRARLTGLEVEVLTVASETLEDVEAAVAAIAARCGVAERGQAFLAEWRRELAPAGLPGKPTVLLSLAREPGRMSQVLTAGPDTFLHQLVERLGAVNAFADAPGRYPQVGPEEILARRPRVVVELRPDPADEVDGERLTADWREILGLAEEDTCVEVLHGDHVLLPGPRLPRLYGELRQAIAGCQGE